MIDSAPEVSELDISPSGFSTIVYDTDGVETTRISAAGSNRELATIEEIPENLKWAFIDIEDERFYEHNGIDLKGIFRAAFVAITNRPSIFLLVISIEISKYRIRVGYSVYLFLEFSN